MAMQKQCWPNLSIVTYPPSRRNLVLLHPSSSATPVDFEPVYEALFTFARNYQFDTDSEDYLIHITTGTHVAQTGGAPSGPMNQHSQG